MFMTNFELGSAINCDIANFGLMTLFGSLAFAYL